MRRATRPVRTASESLFRTAEFDRRWIRIERPTVVVGGELTMDSLELKHDPVSNVSEASLQLKSNCGCLLIDDFGRQRINPTELLNRWIIPLENRIDYLSLSNGRKIEVPFEQLIIFSTNLEPHDLADDAFLRRIPFKVEIGDPVARRISPAVPGVRQEAQAGMPAGDGRLPDPHALPLLLTAAAPLPGPRPDGAGDLLLQLQRVAAGDHSGVSRPRGGGSTSRRSRAIEPRLTSFEMSVLYQYSGPYS